jgi:hypothetical protein
LLLATSPARADNVKASVKGSTLVLKGDSGSNELALATMTALKGSATPTTVTVTPGGDTTVNGSASAAAFDGVVSVKANLGAGDDALTLEDFEIDGTLSVNGASGDDAVTLDNAVVGSNCKINGGPGTLTLNATLTNLDKNLSVKAGGPGAGPNALTFSALVVDSNTSISLGAGHATLTDTDFSNYQGSFKFKSASGTLAITDASIGGAASIKLGTGGNDLTLTDAFVGGNLVVGCSGGADVVRLFGTNVDIDCKVTLAAGANTVVIDRLDLVPGPGSVLSDIGGKLKITAGGGADNATVEHGTHVGSSCSILLSNGSNDVAVTESSVGDDLVIKTGSGADSADITGTTVGGQTKIDLGSGANTGP